MRPMGRRTAILLTLCVVLRGASATAIHAGHPGDLPLLQPSPLLPRPGTFAPNGVQSSGSSPGLARRGTNRRLSALSADSGPTAGGTDVGLEAIGSVNGSGVQKMEGALSSDEPPSLWSAAFRGREDAVEEFVEGGADVNQRNRNGTTPLYVAAQNGHAAVVERLLAAGAEVNAKSKAGSTPLLVAAHNNHVNIVKLLLENGAFPNSRTVQTGQTALWQASYLGFLEVVQTLLDGGAGVDLPSTSKGATPLYAAVNRGHIEVLSILIDAGASVTTPLTNGVTPLHMASALLRPDMVELLLMNGADPSALDADGDTAADVVGVASPGRNDSLRAGILKLLEPSDSVTTSGSEPSPQGTVAMAGNGSGSKRLSAVMVLVPVLAGLIFIVALTSALRLRSWSHSRVDRAELDPHVRLNDLLSKGLSGKRAPLEFGPEYNSSSMDSCHAAVDGHWDESQDSRDAALMPRRAGGPRGRTGGSRRSKGQSSMLSSPTYSSDDSKALWDTFMTSTRGVTVNSPAYKL
ncbi:unnamed protein product [Ostreobium quekettii]|uniref:Ankyrin repeat n=1 Tax=Ostreobium quekettii TaxID=121088 RepID=A0A8S1J568_9CHLO|nr:unnamed protein product [Ostreobium quekettii]|eukprot:evm.model.scf_179.7 EVM.evm.TU.scf_179.7   scf_179:82066-85173(-)